MLPLFPDPGAIGRREPSAKPPIAVIGAGFSGTLATLHLIRRLPPDQPVLLVERSEHFARGIAYATGDADHLLNVRAANMSALADEPGHFEAWLRERTSEATPGLYATEAGVFASRGLYGRYLRSILDEALRETAGHAQLRLLPDQAVDVIPDVGGFQLVTESGNRLPIAGLVLAMGNLAPPEEADPRICADPWSEKAARPFEGDLPVLIVGTGLTMVDVVVSLRGRGLAGPIVALSRGGLLPRPHVRVTAAWPTPRFAESDRSRVLALTRRLREEVRLAAESGVDWRAVIDSLRPITAELWTGLPEAEKRRFARHARRYWDVHRHRMAPPHAALIDQLRQSGELTVASGRILGLEPTNQAVRVHWRDRTGETRRLDVQRVIRASGIEPMARSSDPLVQRLRERGLVSFDPLGLGIDVDDTLAARDGAGQLADRIWALGPAVRGVFWECVAVPDIRHQACLLADGVTARLRQDAPRWAFAI